MIGHYRSPDLLVFIIIAGCYQLLVGSTTHFWRATAERVLLSALPIPGSEDLESFLETHFCFLRNLHTQKITQLNKRAPFFQNMQTSWKIKPGRDSRTPRSSTRAGERELTPQNCLHGDHVHSCAVYFWKIVPLCDSQCHQ